MQRALGHVAMLMDLAKEVCLRENTEAVTRYPALWAPGHDAVRQLVRYFDKGENKNRAFVCMDLY